MVATMISSEEVLSRAANLKMTKVGHDLWTCEIGRFAKYSQRVGRATLEDGRNCRVRNLTEGKIMLICLESGGTDQEILARFETALKTKKGAK